MIKRLLTVVFVGVLLLGCTEDEKQQVLDLAREALMSKEEKEAKRKAEEYEQAKLEMEFIHQARYDLVSERADVEIRRAIGQSLREKDFPYSDIIVYDIYIKPASNIKEPYPTTIYKYEANFTADIIKNEVFIEKQYTINGSLDFTFLFKDENNYTANNIAYTTTNTKEDFSGDIKNAASHIIRNIANN